ncbi:MAG: hypothetical protein HZA95_00880 [Candidatus Vogelbacteria bacterium]|nr:hypothetical protein [Candidatus Vogelbacteria bacterium]
MLETTLGDKKYYELSEEERVKLIRLGDEAMVNTYPKSNDGYAVACMTKSGNVFTGVSYLSKTYTLTMHSEATALANAAIHGEKDVVAITGPNCHICKQLIYESGLNSGIDVAIIMEVNGNTRQEPISTMMAYPWPEN